MADPGVYWSEGVDHALVWPWGLALLHGVVSLDQATRLWSACTDDTDLHDFLRAMATITGGDLLSAPDFAFAQVGAEVVHSAVRGGFVLRFGALDGSCRVVDARGVTTWVEDSGPTPLTLELGRDTDAERVGSLRPITGGLVPASALAWTTAPARPVAGAPQQPVAAEVLEPVAVAVPESAAVPGDPEAAPVAVAVPVPEVVEVPEVPAAVGSPAVVVPLPVPPIDEDDRPAEVDADVAQAPELIGSPGEPMADPAEPALGAERAGETLVDDGLDDGAPAEVVGTPVDAPVTEGVAVAGLLHWDGEVDFTSLDSVELAAVRPSPVPVEVPASAPDEFIASVPRPYDVASSSVAEADDLADHDGYTVAQFDVDDPIEPATGAAAPSSAGGSEVFVLSAVCEAGHPNPPSRSVCRVCGAGLTDRENVQAARPALGAMHCTDGEVIELTGPIVAGRKPRVDRVRGPELPRLLPLPHGHISANHVQIRLSGWSVLALDLGSRNGTFLRRPGQPAVRLEDETLLVGDDVLDLGHGVRFEFRGLP